MAASRSRWCRATSSASSVDTTPTDFFPIQQGQLARFTGTLWQGFGEVLSTDAR